MITETQPETKLFLPTPSSLNVTAQEVDDFADEFLKDYWNFGVGSPAEWNKLVRAMPKFKAETAAAVTMAAITSPEEAYKAVYITSFVQGLAFALNVLQGRGENANTVPETSTHDVDVISEPDFGC